MSIPVSNIPDVNFASAYEIDKACGTIVGSYNASDGTAVSGSQTVPLYYYAIPHSFTRPVFVDMLISLNNSAYIPQGVDLSNGQSFMAYSDSSNIYLLNTDNSNTIYYYWIVCTWINNYDTTNPLIKPSFQSVANNTSQTTFDSRQNYQKILSQDVQIYDNPGLGTVGSATISHNLGYTPNYKIFFESVSGQVWPNIGNTFNELWPYSNSSYIVDGYIDTSNLNLIYQSSEYSASTFKVWPRIYYDS